MKRAFVVLVLFVGYNSGLIVPSKLNDETTPLLNSDDFKPKMVQMDLENTNIIDEKELYQTGNEKKNVLNERAFVYINQQYKPLQRNQVYNSQKYRINKELMITERLPQHAVITQTSMPANVNSQQFFIPNLKGSIAPKSRYRPPNFKYIDREVKSRFNDDRFIPVKVAKQEIVTAKPSVLRLLHTNPDLKVDKETRSQNIKQNCENPQDMTSYPRHRINYNYGFPSSYAWHGSADRNDDITLREDNMSVEGRAGTNNNALSPLDLKDEDLLLDRYIKDALNGFESSEILIKNDKKKCQVCKKAKSDGLSKCKCDGMDNTDPLDLKRSEENKQEEDKLNPLLESHTIKKLFPYGNDKIIGDESLSDLLK